MRALLLAHRYLGIGVGALMVMWCLSGVVMLFVPFPRLSEEQRLRGLPPLDWNGCCAMEGAAPLGREVGRGFSIEMLAGRPVLRRPVGAGSPLLLDLATGSAISHVSLEQATEVARAFASRSQPAADRVPPHLSPRFLGLFDDDQWTLSSISGVERPLFRFVLDDSANTELYVSSRTGRAVQATTTRERFWSWLGAIPHWLYLARLRRHVALWTALVVYSSLAGCFLTATGIIIGIRQLRRKSGQRWSSYRGFNLWHHTAGLIFGLLTLTWVASGMLSTNPWGLLESTDAEPERARLAGPPLSESRVKAAIHTVARGGGLSGAVSAAFAPVAGRLYFVIQGADGSRHRFDEAGVAAPLTAVEISRIATDLGRGAGPERMTEEDAYFFSRRHAPVRLPVFRVAAGGADGTRYYLDPVSGDIEAKVDRNGKRYRWLHDGLHRIDFLPAIRRGSIGYVLVLLLMSGVLTVCMTGAYLGWRRLARSGSR
jgi:uncharacterized iron-regulated membrane protein